MRAARGWPPLPPTSPAGVKFRVFWLLGSGIVVSRWWVMIKLVGGKPATQHRSPGDESPPALNTASSPRHNLTECYQVFVKLVDNLLSILPCIKTPYTSLPPPTEHTITAVPLLETSWEHFVNTSIDTFFTGPPQLPLNFPLHTSCHSTLHKTK